MSFLTNIAGNAPANTFVYTTTTVSATNGSFENLSATNASIINLTVTTFSPVNINTSNIIADSITTGYLAAANISTTIINSSLTTSAELIATSGTINTFYSGFIESVGALITDINTDDLTAGHIHVSNISLDGTLGGHTANLVQLNAQNINAIVTDSFYVNASQINVVETINVCTINCSNVSASGNISATTFTGRIDGNLAAGQGIALTQVGNITTITNTGIVTDPLTIGTINVSNLSCDQLHVSNISLDGTLGGHTANLVQANVLTVNSSSVNTETLRIEDSANSNFTDVVRGNNITNFIGTYDSTPNDYNFFTKVFTSNQPILQLLGSVDKVVVNKNLSTQSIDATSIHCTGTTLTAILSSDIINSDYEMYINDKNGTGAKTQIHRLTNSYEMFNPTTAVPYKFYTGVNSGTPQLEINTSGIKADISQNIQAGGGIALSTSAGVTTITNIAQTSDPLNLNTLNVSTINSSNINNASVITTFDLNATNVGAALVAAADVLALTASAATTNTSTLNGSTINSGHINNASVITTAALISDTIHASGITSYQTITANNISASGNISAATLTATTGNIANVNSSHVSSDDVLTLTVGANNAYITTANISTGNITTIHTSNISCDSHISSVHLHGDISSNLSAAAGVSLSTTNGITTISSNALSTSTQYAFQVTSNLNNNQSITTGTVAQFDAIEICVPSTSAYNTAGNYYTIQVAGLYKFGVKAFINSDVDNFRLAIFKNGGVLMAMGGAGSEASEAFETIDQMAAGETVYIGCVTGQALVYMAAKHSWWYGHKLQPENNTVSVTTDLSVSTLTAALVGATEVVSTTSYAGFMNTSILNASTVNGDISNNLDQGNNINLVTVAGVTTINAQIPSSYTNLTITNLSSTSITSQDINTSNASIENAIVTSITSTATSYFTNISIAQTFDMAAGSAFKIKNSTGSTLYFYNDATQFNYGTIAGNTGLLNFGSGYNASTIQITGLNVVNMENAAGVNISNTSINNASITTAEIVNLSSPLVGKSRFYSRRQTTSQSPGNTNINYYSNYNLLVSDNPHVTWATPNNATGGANTGFIIQTAGWYRIEYTFNGHSVSYNNRISWFTRLYKNGVTFDADQYVVFMYTRGDNTFTCQWATGNTFCIVQLAVGDYIHTRTNIAKNTALHNNDWSGVEAAWGGTCQFEYLGT